jgi:hypothetical protein
MLDEGSQIGDVLPHTALAFGTFAAAVSAPVVSENPKRL